MPTTHVIVVVEQQTTHLAQIPISNAERYRPAVA
jgi:hypothetical protein